MDQLRKSIEASEQSRIELAELRQDKSKEGMIKYNEKMLEAIERQLNVYHRLRLMGDPESVLTADEMEYVAEVYMGKSKGDTFRSFMDEMRNEVYMQLSLLTAGEYKLPEDSE